MTLPPVAAPLAQLVERSRRLGADRSLVVHGGGNTSAKGTVTDDDGNDQDVMWIKASGLDLRTADESGYPGLRLRQLLEMRGRAEMPDEEMTEQLRLALLDENARRPSIETLMHAFLPYRHVDHVHADAVCALTNHKDGRRVVSEALGENWGYVDWMRTGFPLSGVVGELADRDGVVLAHHGLITWADDSDECYARTLAAVERAREFVAAHRIAPGPPPRHDEVPDDELSRLLLALRGALGSGRPRVLRVDRGLRAIADRPDLPALVAAGVSSADHMLRIKPRALALSGAAPEAAVAAVAGYALEYNEYVERNRPCFPRGSDRTTPFPG